VPEGAARLWSEWGGLHQYPGHRSRVQAQGFLQEAVRQPRVALRQRLPEPPDGVGDLEGRPATLVVRLDGCEDLLEARVALHHEVLSCGLSEEGEDARAHLAGEYPPVLSRRRAVHQGVVIVEQDSFDTCQGHCSHITWDKM